MNAKEQKLRKIIREELKRQLNEEELFLLKKEPGITDKTRSYRFFTTASMPKFSFSLPIKKALDFEKDLMKIEKAI